MSRANELNRLADRAIAKLGMQGAAERLTRDAASVVEAKTGRKMLPSEIDAVFVVTFRWLTERGAMAVHVGQETSRLAQLLRSHPGTPSAREICALSSLAGTS